jgi:hypothetical protein
MGKRWWNKVTGSTKAKRAIAKATGIPTTKSGRRRKTARMMKGGCAILIGAVSLLAVGSVVLMLF